MDTLVQQKLKQEIQRVLNLHCKYDKHYLNSKCKVCEGFMDLERFIEKNDLA